MEPDYSWDAVRHPAGRARFFDRGPLPPFEPRGARFDVGTAYWLAELSRLSYRDEWRDALASAGLRELRRFESKPVTGGVVECARSRWTALVFRGTDELADWGANLSAAPTDWRGGGQVHRGFAGALDRVWSDVERAITGIGSPLVMTGHSQGAALATLAASLIAPSTVYTFGSPRVGDAAFAATLNSVPIYRVVNNRDVVTGLPPTRPFGYTHVGRLVYLADDSTLTIDPDPGVIRDNLRQRRRTALPLFDIKRWSQPARRLADHAPINYVARLSHNAG